MQDAECYISEEDDVFKLIVHPNLRDNYVDQKVSTSVVVSVAGVMI